MSGATPGPVDADRQTTGGENPKVTDAVPPKPKLHHMLTPEEVESLRADKQEVRRRYKGAFLHRRSQRPSPAEFDAPEEPAYIALAMNVPSFNPTTTRTTGSAGR